MACKPCVTPLYMGHQSKEMRGYKMFSKLPRATDVNVHAAVQAATYLVPENQIPYCWTTLNDIHHVSLDKHMNPLRLLSNVPLQLSRYFSGSNVSTYWIAISIPYVATIVDVSRSSITISIFIRNKQLPNELLRGWMQPKVHEWPYRTTKDPWAVYGGLKVAFS